MKLSMDLGAITQKVKGNVSILLSGCLLILLVAELLILRTTVNIVLNSRTVNTLPSALLVRISFDQYDKIAKRFAEGENVPVTPVTGRNPFTSLSASEKEAASPGPKNTPKKPVVVPKEPTVPVTPPPLPIIPPATTN